MVDEIKYLSNEKITKIMDRIIDEDKKLLKRLEQEEVIEIKSNKSFTVDNIESIQIEDWTLELDETQLKSESFQISNDNRKIELTTA